MQTRIGIHEMTGREMTLAMTDGDGNPGAIIACSLLLKHDAGEFDSPNPFWDGLNALYILDRLKIWDYRIAVLWGVCSHNVDTMIDLLIAHDLHLAGVDEKMINDAIDNHGKIDLGAVKAAMDAWRASDPLRPKPPEPEPEVTIPPKRCWQFWRWFEK